MSKLPIYKQAWSLGDEYSKHGIKFVYNPRLKTCFLHVAAAPAAINTEDGAMLIGALEISFEDARDIDAQVENVKSTFSVMCNKYPELSKYIETIH